ncbi:hypothetical protein FB45DRAFT_1012491 [Roridomyces roridus]|uniref:Uncharacterized protein n=1 Tax=Roridomyces roridus TaxID=1738132 RepID=A0AAD7F923_9AGAR|nr:hypothetical protein FB45DRAFT_1012491 [Roridomyces roridus]
MLGISNLPSALSALVGSKQSMTTNECWSTEAIKSMRRELKRGIAAITRLDRRKPRRAGSPFYTGIVLLSPTLARAPHQPTRTTRWVARFHVPRDKCIGCALSESASRRDGENLRYIRYPNLQGLFVDWMQTGFGGAYALLDLHGYHLRTKKSLSGGFPFPIHLRRTRDPRELAGVLVSLDELEPADPILVDKRSNPAGPRGPAVLPQTQSYLVPVSQSVQCNLELQILLVYLYKVDSRQDTSLLWDTPPKCRLEAATWAWALWLLVTEEYFLEKRSIAAGAAPSLHGRFTYENVMAEIEKDVGRAGIHDQFSCVLRRSLPLSAVAKLSFKPAFQSLTRNSNIADMMHAVVDIAKATRHCQKQPEIGLA